MKYVLKKGQEQFEVVDGPLAGRSFKPGVEYSKEQIPTGDLKRFVRVKEPVVNHTSKTGAKSS